ncbi:MAG: glycosyltransferase [Flavobacteriaceae bacterium]
MSKTIFVLHERSTKEHFIALETYAELNDVKVHYREFLIARHFIKSVVRLDFMLFVQQIKNVLFFISLILSKNKKIVIGIAPLDGHLPLLKFFIKRHHVFYFTSWGDWSGKGFPKNNRPNSKSLRNLWKNFLEHDIEAIFCVTKSALDNLKENYHINVPSVVVGHAIDNSIQLEEIHDTNNETKNVQLIYVGRLIETKGIRELIELMQQLDSKKYGLKIVGDGPLKKEVQTASEKYANIHYLGYVNDKKELFSLYSQSDVQLLFSKKSTINHWEELFGMVIIEAMYCGLVTIATKHVGPKSIIENGIDGFLVDEVSMMKETIKILEESSFKNDKMKLNTKKKAESFYKNNLSKKWAQVLDVYY